MIMDEMDLVGQLKNAAPLRSEAYERARTALRGAMAESEAARASEIAPVPEAAPMRTERSSWARDRRLGILGKVAIGAGIGAVAATAAIVVVAPSAPRPAAPAWATSQAPAAQAPAADIKLVSLVTEIKASDDSLQGDASLVVRTQTIDSRPPDVTYNLYTDNGDYYVTDTESALPAAISGHDNLAEDVNAREVEAARYAATGDLDTARKQMVNAMPNAFGLGLSPAEQEKAWEKAMAKDRSIYQQKGIAPPKRPTGKALQNLIDNHLWTGSVDALARGAANPEIRAGVLKLISTIPEVTVKDSTTGGRPTLTLTAGPALFGGSDEQVLTIDARTGMPIRSEVGAPGRKPSSVSVFEVSRVTLADIAAGRF
ncbi:hypothetical protein ABZU32_14670 [Sphaerisporangium sp. NPDC005288]|uniref:hypothetical protein n=1 Tax=Sphaerisporangium sp. NPDC005288 TaxID=3155114 RepID=UPI0033BE564D